MVTALQSSSSSIFIHVSLPSVETHEGWGEGVCVCPGFPTTEEAEQVSQVTNISPQSSNTLVQCRTDFYFSGLKKTCQKSPRYASAFSYEIYNRHCLSKARKITLHEIRPSLVFHLSQEMVQTRAASPVPLGQPLRSRSHCFLESGRAGPSRAAPRRA